FLRNTRQGRGKSEPLGNRVLRKLYEDIMKPRSNWRAPRDGATSVEFAAVSAVLILLLFAIMEFCMIIYTQNIVENAAREGSRYAIVNVSGSTMVSSTKAVVKSFMCNLDTKMSNYSCNVYLADANGNNINNDPTGAGFGQYICVD